MPVKGGGDDDAKRKSAPQNSVQNNFKTRSNLWHYATVVLKILVESGVECTDRKIVVVIEIIFMNLVEIWLKKKTLKLHYKLFPRVFPKIPPTFLH